MTAFVPTFVTELTDAPGHVTDCVPASGLMLVNKVTHNKYAASIAEREALQNAMGTQDEGANLPQLQAGIAKRYGLQLPPAQGWTALASLLAVPTKGAVIVGNYQSLPAALRNQANQPTFNGGHAIYAQGNGAGGIIIGDPLGWRFDAATSLASLKAFADSYGDQYLPAGEQSSTVVGYRLGVSAGTTTFYQVMRFTHALYGARPATFSHPSSAPVSHGSPGFWRITAGPLAGFYAVAGHTAFTITAVYSDGHTTPVDVRS